MQPFDKLTNENIDFIKAYIDSYVNAKVDDLRPVLSVWNKNKRTLFKALGGELQVSLYGGAQSGGFLSHPSPAPLCLGSLGS